MENQELPAFLAPLFWEIDFAQLRIPGRERYIIERILEYGDLAEARWLEAQFTRAQIMEVVRHSRVLSKRSAVFWMTMLEIPREEVLCLTNSFREKHRRIWQR